MKMHWFCGIAGFALLGLGSPGGVEAQVTETPFGSPQFVANPSWQPTDFVMFSAAGSTFDHFRAVNRSLLPPPDHAPNDQVGVAPGAPHPPPYDRELSPGAVAAGYTLTNVFTLQQFSDPNGINFD